VYRTYRLGEARIGVRTTSRVFGAWLDQALSAHRVQEESGTEYSIVVDGGVADGGLGEEGRDEQRSLRRYHILYRGTAPLVRTLHLTVLGRALLAELAFPLLAEREDAVFVRAAPVRLNGSAALAPWWVVPYLGELGRRVDRAGLGLPATTWVAVDPGSGRVVPAPPALNVSRGSLAQLDRAGPTDLEAPLFVDRPLDVAAVFAHLEQDTVIQPAPRSLALQTLAGAAANLTRMGGDALEGLGRLVAGARCFGLSTAPARQMLEALAAVLTHSAAQGDVRLGQTASRRYRSRRTEDTSDAR
jgi:hypothetical protein